jgi:quinol monooxygenase YgiN
LEEPVSVINVVAVLKVKEGKADAVREAFSALVDQSRKDAGCLRYDLFEVQDEPGTFVNIESWASQAELDAHMQAPHLGAAFAGVGDAFDGAPQLLFLAPVNVR